MPDHFRYDLFISYSSTDAAWVRGELLTALEGQGLRVCIDVRDFAPGAPSVSEMEWAVQASRKTLLVLTPHYLTSAWTAFETFLLQTLDPANQQRRLIPLRKEPCSPPLRINYLTHVNFVDPHDRDQEWQRLFAALQPPGDPDSPIAPTNPFTDHGRINEPDRFFGRQRVLREVQQLLTAGNSVALIGASEIGKSSLLYYLHQTQAIWSPAQRVCYLDLQRVLDERDFCDEILQLIGARGNDLSALKRALRQQQLTLLLDEVQILTSFKRSRLQDLLRALVQDGNLLLLVAGRRPLVELFPPNDPTSPLHNVFTERRLGPFTELETQDFLVHRLQGAGVTFEKAEIDALYQQSNGHPARLQRGAERLFDRKMENT